MNRHVNAISGRLSLRAPQRESLEILARVTDILPPKHGHDLSQALSLIRSEFPTVEDFERDFPSLCFALATGVGKTRLMGAFIAYLRLEHKIRHFFVLAPNLTIYTKLIADFTPNTPKYVFQGIGEFASTPPEIITGDNYDTGRTLFRSLEEQVHINIFNISKINTEVRGGASPRIRTLSEYIGQSYFDYLAGLDDLVLLMDESHRYRASAGVKAINELKPILGLELTATPRSVGVSGAPFKNVIYSYPLSEAMKHGFVKEPAVVTKEDFKPENYSPGEIELIKLEDGVRVHEHTKVQLETYSRQYDVPLVRPFMLVVAQDTTHADELEKLIKSERFFEGRYADKVITVHSNQQGELKDEMVERLLKVEHAHDERAPEIVIHVNKLGEGWDVTNLYTIVPLRRFVAEILTEQTLGRGLRLPYGKRVGVDAVDTLHIVAHDKFEAIIKAAKEPNSIIRKGVVIGRDIPIERKQTVTVSPNFTPQVASPGQPARQAALVYTTAAEKRVADITVETVRQFEYLPRSADLTRPEVMAQVVREVQAAYDIGQPLQGALEGIESEPPVDVTTIAHHVIARIADLTIGIPRIVMQPTGEVTIRYRDFDLDARSIHVQPVDQNLLVQSLSSDRRWSLQGGELLQSEPRLENYLISGLSDKSDVNYQAHSDLLYNLAAQMVHRLQSYLPDEAAVLNALVYHRRTLVDSIHAQMLEHQSEVDVEYEAKVSKGFTVLRSNSFDALAADEAVDYRNEVAEKLLIRGMSFGGFARCLYPVQKFQSDAERRFAVVLENEPGALRWFKPAPRQFPLYLKDKQYEPDFVVETNAAKLLVETKKSDLLTDADVLAKANAAFQWCKHATAHASEHGDKPWTYLLIPDNAITHASTLAGLTASFTYHPV